jgi:hypothetical protein
MPQIDSRAQARGVRYTPLSKATWAVQSCHMITEAEGNGGRHHVYVLTLDALGNPMSGVPVRFWWAEGDEVKVGQAKYDAGRMTCCDWPMYAAGQSYGVMVQGEPSDSLFGFGLGPTGKRDDGHHVSYYVTFRRQVVAVPPPVVAPPPTQPPEPRPIDEIDALCDQIAAAVARLRELAHA